MLSYSCKEILNLKNEDSFPWYNFGYSETLLS